MSKTTSKITWSLCIYKLRLDIVGFRVFGENNAQIVVDKETIEFIKGSKIDYQEELIRSAFVVVGNPQAEEGCSCGVSFNVKL